MPQVVMYSTPTCGFCKLAKQLFNEHNIPFIEKDVAQDLVAREEMVTKSRQLGVPVIDIDGTIIVGFHQPKIRELLHI